LPGHSDVLDVPVQAGRCTPSVCRDTVTRPLGYAYGPSTVPYGPQWVWPQFPTILYTCIKEGSASSG
jgi:hypothetical protein